MSDHLVTTKIRAGRCRTCRLEILTGLAEGLPTHADPTPLNPTGEIQALIDNLWTYTATPDGLLHRDTHRITGNSITGTIHADHQCGRIIPPEHRATPESTSPVIPAQKRNEEMLF